MIKEGVCPLSVKLLEMILCIHMLQLKSLFGEKHYSFFMFAMGHPIQPANLIFGMKAHCSLDRAKTILRPFSPNVFRVGAKRVENSH